MRRGRSGRLEWSYSRAPRLPRLTIACFFFATIVGVLFLRTQLSEAAVSCGVSGPSHITIISTSEGRITLARAASGVILVNDSPCGTVTTVDTITVNGSTGAEEFVVDMTNGPFGPGIASEPGDTPEIEIDGDLGAGTGRDFITILGQDTTTTNSDNIVAGGASWPRFSLNAGPSDADADLTVSGFEGVTIDLQSGDDAFSGQGGFGTGTPVLMAMGIGTELDFEIPPLRGGAGADNLTGGNGVDALQGGPGDDVIDGAADTDIASYTDAPGPDGIVANPAEHTVTGHSTDTVANLETFVGSPFDDTFYDDPDHCDTFIGGGGNDKFIAINRPGSEEGGTCGDQFDGGPGRDAYDATSVPTGIETAAAGSPGVVFDFANGVVHGSGDDTCTECEGGRGTESGADVFQDDPAKCNVFNGNGGDDTFVAVNRPGSEEGGTCGDTFNGGEGGETEGDLYDAANVPANSPGVIFDFANGIVHGSGEDTCTECENGTGTTGDDEFIDEDNSCNDFNAGEGDDLFRAGVQRPGSEHDPSRGDCGDGVDLGQGGETTGDTVDYGRTEANSPGVVIDLATGIVHGSPEDTARNAENAFGSEFDDHIIGTAGDNKILGRGGDDIIDGGGGNDKIDGGPGNDTINGVPEGPGPEPTTGFVCNLETRTLVQDGVTTHGIRECPAGGPGDDVFIGNDKANTFHGGGGNDRLEGRGGNDQLFGDDGDDQLFGGEGKDRLFGGNGNDSLNGGEGADKLDGGADMDTLNGGEGANRCANGEELRACGRRRER